MKKEHTTNQDKPFGLSLLVGLFGFFLIPTIVSYFEVSLLSSGNDNFSMHFLSLALEKFALVFWIIITVLFIEHNDFISLGFVRSTIQNILYHALVLFIVITITFFLVFLPGLFISGDIGPGFATTKTLITSVTFWFFILASAISEEIFFRAFLIMRLTWISEVKSVSLLAVSLIYGILHYSLWGSVGALSFGVWGFIIGFYYAYIKQDVIVTSSVHFASDVVIFLVSALVIGL